MRSISPVTPWAPFTVAALLVISVSNPVGAQSKAPDDTAAVRSAAERFIFVFENLDWDAFQAAWASEPTVFFPFDDTPGRVTGRRAVESRWRRFFDEVRARGSGPPYLQIRPRDLRVTPYGEAALVTFNLGGPPGPMGRRTLVFVKEEGEWKLAHLHASTAGRP